MPSEFRQLSEKISVDIFELTRGMVEISLKWPEAFWHLNKENFQNTIEMIAAIK
jgi:hypothetical protein